MLSGDNGILNRTELARENTRAGEINDIISIAVSENKIYEYSNGTKTTKNDLVEKLHNEKKLTDTEYNMLMGLEGQTKTNTITIGTITVDFSKLDFIEYKIGDIVDIPGLASFEGINWIYFGKDSNGNDLVTTSKGIENAFLHYRSPESWLVCDLQRGEAGYNEATETNNINKACEKVCADNGGTIGEVRSITVQDINKVVGFTEPNFREYTFIAGDTNNYANDEVNYYYPDLKGAGRTSPSNVSEYYVKAGEILNGETIPTKKFKCDFYSYGYDKYQEKYVVYWERTDKSWQSEEITLKHPENMKYVTGEDNMLEYATASHFMQINNNSADIIFSWVAGGGINFNVELAGTCGTGNSTYTLGGGAARNVSLRPIVVLSSGDLDGN